MTRFLSLHNHGSTLLSTASTYRYTTFYCLYIPPTGTGTGTGAGTSPVLVGGERPSTRRARVASEHARVSERGLQSQPMRLKRVRRARKLLSFFRAVHGFKPPYDVLLDSTAIQAAVLNGVDLAVALPKVFGEKVRLFVPRAVVAELHVLGRKFAAAAKVARRLKVLSTTDGSVAASAADGILDLVTGGNTQHRFVMTEDPALRKRLADLTDVPTLRFARSEIIIELPGGRTAASTTAETSGLMPAAPQAVSGAAGGAMHERMSGQASRSAPDPLQGDLPGDAPSKKRKRGPKQPNPLSVKKKKKLAVGEPPVAPLDAQNANKRRRKRGKGAQQATDQQS